MTNPDTNTLDGSLDQLGITMADNLVAMGVSGASAADGLTTLANNILDIAPSVGGITPTVSIDLSKSPTLICRGATVDIMALVHADYDDESIADVDLKGYLQGATVTFKNGNTGIGYAVSDNDGIATLVINDIAMGNYSIVGSFDGTGTDYESATSSAMTFTVNDYPTITLSADKTTVNVGETVTFTITAMYNNTPVVGYPIQLYKDGSSMGSLYAGITNNDGECVISYIIPNDAVNFTINSNQLSNNLNINVTNYIFVDDCSTDKTSNYTIQSITNNNATVSFQTDHYQLTRGNTGATALKLPTITLPNQFTFEAELYCTTNISNTQTGIGIFNNNNFYAVRYLNNSSKADYYTCINGSEAGANSSNTGNKSNQWVKYKLEYNNGTVTFTVCSTDETSTYYTLTKTNLPTPTGLGIYLAYDGNATEYIRNIKVKEI